MSPIGPAWDELGKIDYLLDQLARAVERGEVGLEVYERLAPRYLERRAEVALQLTRQAERPSAPTGSFRAPVSPVPAAARVAHRTAPAPRPAISPGAWMTYAGAFLVVVSVAIFTIYAWAAMPVFVKLAVLAAVTLAFYAGGELVRTRMRLPAVGVALIGVGSAMLVFDGWAVINGFGLSGPLPWALLLLACSLVYWRTEMRIVGGWFGAIGAAAQVGWWWLLGQALHFPAEWQVAGIAVVALMWSLAGDRVEGEGPLAALGTVLRTGSALLVVLTSVSMLGRSLDVLGHGTIGVIAAAVLTAVAATIVVERRAPELGRFSAALHVPVVLALMAYDGSPGLVAAVCAFAAIAYAAYAIVRGGAGYAAISLFAAVMSVPMVGEHFGWETTLSVAVLGALFAAAAAAGSRLRLPRSMSGGGSDAGPRSGAGSAWHWMGLGGLALVAFPGVPIAGDGLPLLAAHMTGEHVLLAAWVLAMWAVVAAVSRRQVAGWPVVACSFYALAAGAGWVLPGLHSAWYAAALLLLAAAWRQAEPWDVRALRLAPAWLLGSCRVLFLAIPLVGLVASEVFFSVRAYPVAALLALAALVWGADALRSKSWWSLAPASVFLVAATFLAAWRASDLADAAVAAAAVAAAVALAGAFGPRRRDGWGAYLAAGGALAGTFLVAGAVSEPDRLTVALVLVAASWALTAVAADLQLLFGVAGLVVSLALRAALDWLDPSPLVAIASYSALAAALFAPRGFSLGAGGSALRRASRALGAAGLATAAQLALIGLYRTGFAPELGAHALQVGEVGLGVGLLVSGAIVVLGSAVERFEPGEYLGYGIGLLGIFALMDRGGVTQAEFYLLAVAAYAIAMGLRYVRAGEGRRMPAAADSVAFAAAVAAPFLLSLNQADVAVGLQHGLWALGLSVAAIAAGLLTRTRLHFLGGMAVAALEALWLSRSVLFALPTWFWIGLAGLALIAGGVTFARRELLGAASRRVNEGLAGWR